MSSVTNVLLVTYFSDHPLVDDLNAWMIEQHQRQADALVELTSDDARRLLPWGGTKNPECGVYAAALNHWDLHALVAKVESLVWRERNAVQLFLKDEDDASFGVWMFAGERLAEVLEPRTYDGGPRLPFNANHLHNLIYYAEHGLSTDRRPLADQLPDRCRAILAWFERAGTPLATTQPGQELIDEAKRAWKTLGLVDL